jgi:uncharacterized protein YraI
MRRIAVAVLTGIFLCLSAGVVAAEETRDEKFEPVYGTILADKVNVRAGQGLNFEVLGQLNEGASVGVIGQEYGWYKVKLLGNTRCFVHKDYIKDGLVMADKLRIRAGAGTNFSMLGFLRRGDAVDVLDEQNGWLKIAPPQEAVGWVKKDYLQLGTKKYVRQPPEPRVIIKEEKPAETALPDSPEAKTDTPQGEGQVLPLEPGEKMVAATGKIKDLGRLFRRRGTHKLVRGRKTLYYLKSETIDLKNYVHQNVCVMGHLKELKRSRHSLIDVQQIKEEK